MTIMIAIDLETLGTRVGAPITGVGLVLFDEGSLIRRISYRHDLSQAVAVSQNIDGGTVGWWFDQIASNPALAEQFRDGMPTANLVKMVREFFVDARTFVKDSDRQPGENEEWPIEVWGNPARFDMGILENLFDQMGVEVPWHHWEERCMRTALAVLGNKVRRVRPDEHLKHDAMADALAQSETIQRIKGASA